MTNKSDDDPAVEVSSPACVMHEADDAYRDFAGRGEVLAFLNGLLEAERAGARVTLETARAADNKTIAELMRTIQRDEARWCAMLARYARRRAVSQHRRFLRQSHGRRGPWRTASLSSIAARAGWCERYVRCSHGCATVDCTRSLPRCCNHTRPIPRERGCDPRPVNETRNWLLPWSSTVVRR